MKRGAALCAALGALALLLAASVPARAQCPGPGCPGGPVPPSLTLEPMPPALPEFPSSPQVPPEEPMAPEVEDPAAALARVFQDALLAADQVSTPLTLLIPGEAVIAEAAPDLLARLREAGLDPAACLALDGVLTRDQLAARAAAGGAAADLVTRGGCRLRLGMASVPLIRDENRTVVRIVETITLDSGHLVHVVDALLLPRQP